MAIAFFFSSRMARRHYTFTSYITLVVPPLFLCTSVLKLPDTRSQTTPQASVHALVDKATDLPILEIICNFFYQGTGTSDAITF